MFQNNLVNININYKLFLMLGLEEVPCKVYLINAIDFGKTKMGRVTIA